MESRDMNEKEVEQGVKELEVKQQVEQIKKTEQFYIFGGAFVGSIVGGLIEVIYKQNGYLFPLTSFMGAGIGFHLARRKIRKIEQGEDKNEGS